MIRLSIEIPSGSKEQEQFHKRMIGTNGTISMKKLLRLIESTGNIAIITNHDRKDDEVKTNLLVSKIILK